MDKKLIIRNTFVLLATVATFLAAQLFLGTDNIILSIVVFLIALFILNKDFTGSPIRIFSKIMSLTLFIGIVPYIANMNMFIGLPINFIAIFLMLYLLVYRLKKSIYFPFLLGYTLLLCVSPSKHFFYLRIGALTVIGFVSFLIQVTINRKRSYKNKHNNLQNMLKTIYSITDDVFYDNASDSLSNFDTILNNWNNEVFETRNNNFYLKKREDIELNIISSFEKLKIDIIALKGSENLLDINFIYNIKNSICTLRKFANDEINVAKLNADISNRGFLFKEDTKLSHIIYEIEESLIIIKNLLIELRMTDTTKLNMKENTYDFLTSLKVLKGHFNTNSVRFTFAFRTALTISVIYFLIQFFNIEHGSWIIYTIASVSQPYNDTLKKRSFNRVKGTILGAIFFLILFYIFKNNIERYIILMITIYINSFVKSYDKQITYITLLVLGLTNMSDPSRTILSFDRIYLVIIGVIITLVSGRLILPYYIAKETEFLINTYHTIGEDVVNKLLNITKVKNNRLEIQNQALLARSIENKILINNTALDSDLLKKFLLEERYLLTKAKSIINRVEYADISLQYNRDERISRLNDMQKNIDCIYKDNYIKGSIPSCILPYFKDIEKTSEKLIYRDIFEILVNAKMCTILKQEILSN